MSEIAILLGAASKSLELVKKGLEAKGELKRVEDRETIVSAKEALLDVKEAMLELRAENISLKKRQDDEKDYLLDQAVYWKKADVSRSQPYCPTCKAKNLIMPMTPNQQNTNVAYFTCPNPECHFGTKLNGYTSPSVVKHIKTDPMFGFGQNF